MNILLLILDGLADRPQQALGGKTPLAAARTPNMDRLAELGTNGLLIPLAPGIPLESEFSHFLLFGYPSEQFPGRAAFEAIGRGFDIPRDNVVLLASFATTTLVEGKVRRETILWEDQRPQDEEDCEQLCAAIADHENQGVGFKLESCGRCEAILTLSGNPSRFISDVDPFYNGAFVARALPLAEDVNQENAERTATALNQYLHWVRRCLTAHPINVRRQQQGLPPINFLLTKWAGVRPQVPPFREQNGLRAASVEHYPLYVGIARVCGMTSVSTPQQLDIGADLREKLRAADELFRQGYEFVHVHSKAPDVAGHRKDPIGKQHALEAIDSALGPLVQWIEHDPDLLIVVTGDHATPSSGSLIHSGEAVPLLIAGGPNGLVDDVREFHERAAIHGGLGRVTGADLMPLLLNLTDRIRLHGVRHQRQSRLYWSGATEVFTIWGDE
ncbi:MAG: 2,3-bisphosphoglycerate-independent phosphoglycerate mutase [Deltaproteobacteria bacterium]|nr:2,3-bisphosphoglycerate-independent phosphoglycerate mutase [Deltaproteobacteria bacterium]